MKLIFFMGNNIKEIEIDGNNQRSVLDLAVKSGVFIDGTCAGNGTCGKCKVLITKGGNSVLNQDEKNALTEEEIKRGYRLACKFIPTEDCCIIVQKNSGNSVSPNLNRSKENENGMNQRNMESLDRMKVNQKNDQTSNNIYSNQSNQIYPKHKLKLGLAIDIGTTSVEGIIWDINTRLKLASTSMPNPQRTYGADVISRINYSCRDKENFNTMVQLIRECCNQMIESLRKEVQQRSDLEQLVVVGNSTMSHLFAGISVECLAKAPFQPQLTDGLIKQGDEIGIQMKEGGVVKILPNIGGYVGSDTLACILVTDLDYREGVHLILDIGTNGEIVLADQGEMVCCSTAAGPAFEGGVIYQGMRAEIGAITDFKLEGARSIVTVVGDVKPEGICGSGIINILAELLKHNIVDSTGRIQSGNPIVEEEENNRFVVLYEEKDGSKVVLTQKDIREIQLAKAAISTGIYTLLKERNLSIEDLDSFCLAGAFGSNINLLHAIRVGLIPSIPIDKIDYIGNGALDGASRVLLGDISDTRVNAVAGRVRHIELALNDEFHEKYMEEINFK